MQFLSYVLFQLDEARRYIEDGRLQHLRLAFLLLDNAVEIQMDRRIRHDLESDELKERLRNQSLVLATQSKLPKGLQELIDWEPLTPTQKRDLDRNFNEKVSYMVGRGGHLDASLAEPLEYLHKYRNEAYHRTRIRPETIRTATLIMLEINCQMLLKIRPATRTYASDGDYSWLERRFHVKSISFGDTQLQSIVSEIRSGLLPTDTAVADTLANHLRDRFSSLYDSLDFIVENGGFTKREEALGESESYAYSQLTSGQPQPTAAKTFVPRYSLRFIEDLEARTSEVLTASTRVRAFDCFATVEKELERVEECVNELAGAIDCAIDLAIDIARGK